MSLSDEKYNALKQGKRLIEDLCDPGKTPRVPSAIRDRAKAALRHYPSDIELDITVDCELELSEKKRVNDVY